MRRAEARSALTFIVVDLGTAPFSLGGRRVVETSTWLISRLLRSVTRAAGPLLGYSAGLLGCCARVVPPRAAMPMTRSRLGRWAARTDRRRRHDVDLRHDDESESVSRHRADCHCAPAGVRAQCGLWVWCATGVCGCARGPVHLLLQLSAVRLAVALVQLYELEYSAVACSCRGLLRLLYTEYYPARGRNDRNLECISLVSLGSACRRVMC